MIKRILLKLGYVGRKDVTRFVGLYNYALAQLTESACIEIMGPMYDGAYIDSLQSARKTFELWCDLGAPDEYVIRADCEESYIVIDT